MRNIRGTDGFGVLGLSGNDIILDTFWIHFWPKASISLRKSLREMDIWPLVFAVFYNWFLQTGFIARFFVKRKLSKTKPCQIWIWIDRYLYPHHHHRRSISAFQRVPFTFYCDLNTEFPRIPRGSICYGTCKPPYCPSSPARHQDFYCVVAVAVEHPAAAGEEQHHVLLLSR